MGEQEDTGLRVTADTERPEVPIGREGSPDPR